MESISRLVSTFSVPPTTKSVGYLVNRGIGALSARFGKNAEVNARKNLFFQLLPMLEKKQWQVGNAIESEGYLFKITRVTQEGRISEVECCNAPRGEYYVPPTLRIEGDGSSSSIGVAAVADEHRGSSRLSSASSIDELGSYNPLEGDVPVGSQGDGSSSSIGVAAVADEHRGSSRPSNSGSLNELDLKKGPSSDGLWDFPFGKVNFPFRALDEKTVIRVPSWEGVYQKVLKFDEDDGRAQRIGKIVMWFLVIITAGVLGQALYMATKFYDKVRSEGKRVDLLWSVPEDYFVV